MIEFIPTFLLIYLAINIIVMIFYWFEWWLARRSTFHKRWLVELGLMWMPFMLCYIYFMFISKYRIYVDRTESEDYTK